MRSIQKCHCSVLCINAQYFLRQINAQFCSVCIYTLDRKVCVGTMRFLVKNTSVPASKESDHPLAMVLVVFTWWWPWPMIPEEATCKTIPCRINTTTKSRTKSLEVAWRWLFEIRRLLPPPSGNQYWQASGLAKKGGNSPCPWSSWCSWCTLWSSSSCWLCEACTFGNVAMNSAIFFAVCGQLLSISYDTVVGWTVPLPLSMGFNELEFESIAKRRRWTYATAYQDVN